MTGCCDCQKNMWMRFKFNKCGESLYPTRIPLKLKGYVYGRQTRPERKPDENLAERVHSESNAWR